MSDTDKDKVKCEIYLKKDMQEKAEIERLEREALLEKARAAELLRLKV